MQIYVLLNLIFLVTIIIIVSILKHTSKDNLKIPKESKSYNVSFVTEQLQYWHKRDIPLTIIENIHIVWIENGTVKVLKESKYDGQKFLYVKKALEKVSRLDTTLKGPLFINCCDNMVEDQNVPILSFNIKKDRWGKGALLLPDAYCLSFYTDRTKSHYYSDFKFRDTVPWDKKKISAVFRGQETNILRTHLVRQSYTEYDVKIIGDIHKNRIPGVNDYLYGEYMSKRHQSKYKYLINIDGYGSAWNRTVWHLRSNSIMLMYTNFISYSTYGLEPHIHYVPLRIDEHSNNVTELINKMEDNPIDAYNLQKNATAFIKERLALPEIGYYIDSIVKGALDICKHIEKDILIYMIEKHET